ncbi:hypothetical protein SDC9_165865 [bioreactor metagenome]|uniref:Uncharacterized protein n=1 Tax=bioreactor metagenome TaxID=1076179 RepID=A0A645FVL9_9ZZZZ
MHSEKVNFIRCRQVEIFSILDRIFVIDATDNIHFILKAMFKGRPQTGINFFGGIFGKLILVVTVEALALVEVIFVIYKHQRIPRVVFLHNIVFGAPHPGSEIVEVAIGFIHRSSKPGFEARTQS